MKIFVSGTLNAAGAALCQALSEQGHSVFVLHPDPWALECAFREEKRSLDSLTAAELDGFDAVVCLADPQQADDTALLAEAAISRALPLLLLEQRSLQAGAPPRPSAAACLLQHYQRERGLKGCALSIPAVYGVDFLPQAFEEIAARQARTNLLQFPGSPEALCDLLHAEDAAALLGRLLERSEALPSSLCAGSGQAFLMKSAAAVFQAFFPQSELRWQEDARPGSAAFSGVQAVPGWQPAHRTLEELPEVLREIHARLLQQGRLRSGRRLSGLARTLLFLGTFAAVWAYAHFLHAATRMQFVDARLLFVIAASVTMGSRWGIAAALLAAASGIADQLMSGVAWHVLFFRPSNWIPYAVYLASAILFGLYRERHFRGREDEDDGLRG